MVKAQSRNMPPWKVVPWLSNVLEILGNMEHTEHLDKLLLNPETEIVEDLFPKLNKHRGELMHDSIEKCIFNKVPVMEGDLAFQNKYFSICAASRKRMGK